MKIALVLLNETVARINKGWVTTFGRMAYAPTTLTQLAALVPEHLNAQIELFDEGVSIFDPEKIDADLVGLSVLTPNAARAYTMAACLKKRGITVVLGGVHPTLLPDEAALHADAVVIGFAEKSWPALLEDFANKKLRKIYSDDYKEEFRNSLPVPRYDLLKKRKYFLPYTLEATRGCMNKCTFCVISGCSNYSSFVSRDIEAVTSQIQSSGAKNITFLDSSPTENPEYIKSLYRRLIPLKIKWNSSITLKVAEDKDWLELASKSGCNGVLIGFESLNQESLSGGNKNFNQVNRYKDAIRKLHDHNITVLACFVFGFDSDTPDIFQRTVDFVNEAKIDLLNYTILTPYPQTAIYNQLLAEGRIIDTEWKNYNGAKVVFQPARMSVSELQKGYEKASLQSYSAKSIVKRLLPLRNSFAANFASNTYFSIYNHLRFKSL
jgi:radical SAM superfamily enzyme YgiQ (UPF0313 family)